MSATGPDKSATGQVLRTHVDTSNFSRTNESPTVVTDYSQGRMIERRLNRAERRELARRNKNGK